MSGWDLPKPQSEPNPRTEIDKLDINKLNIEQDSPKEEQVEVTDSLVPLPTSEEEKATMEGTMEETMEETTEELTEAEERYQLKEENCALYQRVYVGQLSDEEQSDTGSDYSGYSYFGKKKEHF